MNLYLSFDHTETENGTTFYYFRAGLFHGSGLTDLLLLLTDIDLVELLSLPTSVPSFLPEGTLTQHLDGTGYEVPEDLFLLMIKSKGISPVSSPLADVLEDGISSQAICVYANTPTTGSSTYPDGLSPEDKAPNVSAYPGWYIGSLSLQTITISSRKSSYPFWTKSCFNFWDAYGTGEYNCEGLPYNIHVTCNPSELSNWEQPSDYNDHGYWRVDGYYRNIESNLSTWRGFDLEYDPGTLAALEGEQYRPSDSDDPIIYYPIFNVYDGPFTLPSPLSLFIPFAVILATGKVLNPLSILRYWLNGTNVAAPRNYIVVANASDKVVINTSDYVEVGF